MMYDVKFLAALLNVSERTIWRWADSGYLPQPVMVGPWTVRFPAEAIHRWLEGGCKGRFKVKRRNEPRNKGRHCKARRSSAAPLADQQPTFPSP